MSEYREIVIQTHHNYGAPSSKRIRARPLPGQGLNTDLNVACSASMREKHPVGTKFVVWGKVTNREGGNPFLYTHYQRPYRVVTDEEAAAFIRGQDGGRS